MTTTKAVITLALLALTVVQAVHVAPPHATLVTHYRDECFRKKARTKAHKTQLAQVPGAGLGEIDPFTTVLKDGYLPVECVKDYMYTHGDKFGDNKHEYTLGGVSNVSIVHYAAHVPKEDRKPMTPEVCFDFCRTVPDMLYFGIKNGRSCYCEPYYKAMESDSSQCDDVCEGDRTLMMCGGQVKSSIFEMHSCDDGPLMLGTSVVRAHAVKTEIDLVVEDAKKAAKGKNELAQTLQDSLGQAGDPVASDLMQVAKVSAGRLLHLAEDVGRLGEEMDKPIEAGKTMTGLSFSALGKIHSRKDSENLEVLVAEALHPTVNFKSFENADKAEALEKTLRDLTPKATKSRRSLESALLASGPEAAGSFFVQSGRCTIDENGCFVPPTPIGDGGDHVELECEVDVTAPTTVDFTISAWIPYRDDKDTLEDLLPVSDDRAVPRYSNDGFYGPADGSSVHGAEIPGKFLYFLWGADQGPSSLRICPRGRKDEEQSTAGVQYYSLMYFADKAFTGVPSTCSGTPVGQPIYGKNYHTCAAACDHDPYVRSCVGFFYYPRSKGKSLCFMFSDFKTATYWTGCGGKGPKAKFLQMGRQAQEYKPIAADEEPETPVCVAKFTEFNGLSIKPDGSGKCPHCLKELKQADRCYQ